jgi:hypothetical protein
MGDKEHDMEEMTAEQAREWGKTLSFESTWAAITKLGERIDKLGERADETWAAIKLTDENLDKSEARWNKRFDKREAMYAKRDAIWEKKSDKLDAKINRTTEAVKQMSERVDKLMENVGGLNRSIGELIETLIAARLWEKFARYPYHLERAYRRIPIYNERNEIKTDIDILLSDTEWCMAVEVKREVEGKDVDKQLQRMELIRKYPPAEVNGKKMLGAIAGGVVPPDIRDYAQASGFFVLELTGESVTLLDPPKDFTAREW